MSVLQPGGKVQHLIDTVFECDQISRHEFIAGAGEFVPVANFEKFPQTFIGILCSELFYVLSLKKEDKAFPFYFSSSFFPAVQDLLSGKVWVPSRLDM
jgi:hypothetical protein